MSDQRRPQRDELLLQLERHRLIDDLPYVLAQLDLELVAAAAPRAIVQVRLRLHHLRVREHAVEVRLHQLLALLARDLVHPSSPTADSASCAFRIRRPLCSRDITVPTGMSRICAASW